MVYVYVYVCGLCLVISLMVKAGEAFAFATVVCAGEGFCNCLLCEFRWAWSVKTDWFAGAGIAHGCNV